MRLRLWLVLGCLPFISPFADAEEVVDFDNSDCFLCHDDKEFVYEEGLQAGKSLHVSPGVFAESVHGRLTCIECHDQMDLDGHPDTGPSPAVSCKQCHEEQSDSYGHSAHGANGPHYRAANEPAPPGCADCHGTHNILPSNDIRSPLYFIHLIDTCGKCHEQVAEDVAASVHGAGKARGRKDSPVCTDCHQEHAVQPLNSASAIAATGEVCAQCHASERLNTRYGIPGDLVETYYQSYHGLASKLDGAEAANCASCHGHHLILNSSDPRSNIHPDNLVQTCGKCHPGATTKFASGSIHHPSAKPGGADLGAIINGYIRLFYKALIVVVIGFMLIHNVLAWRARVIVHMRNPERAIERMSRPMRIQHTLLALSFTYLAISGFALAYPESIFAFLLGSNEGFRMWSHRIVGVFMILLGCYHVYYVLATKEGRQLARDMWPAKKDWADLAANFSHYLGRRKERARFGRFGYPEKIEYWAVFWGTGIMAITGMMIWMKLPVTQVLPRWAIDVATSIHLYEAILAVLAILVWHLYHVAFCPGSYPINPSCIDGKVTKKWMEHEHPLACEPETPPPSEDDAEPAEKEEAPTEKPQGQT